jgi:hypothetical protein
MEFVNFAASPMPLACCDRDAAANLAAVPADAATKMLAGAGAVLSACFVFFSMAHDQ